MLVLVRTTYSCRAHRHACVCTHAVTHTLCSCVLLMCCACMVHAINAAVVTVCVARVLLVEHPCRLPSHSVVAVTLARTRMQSIVQRQLSGACTYFCMLKYMPIYCVTRTHRGVRERSDSESI